MSKKRTLSPVELERVQTIKTNSRRANLSMENLAESLETTTANFYGAFTGRYSEEATDNTLTELETYLKGRLGVRYIAPYFDDLDEY